MAPTLANLPGHVSFSAKDRELLIAPELKPSLITCLLRLGGKKYEADIKADI